MPPPERWIVLPDIHTPFEDKKTLRAVEAYMADHRWDGWLQLGDLVDFKEISRFEEFRKGVKPGSIAANYKAGNTILDRHQAIVRKKNKKAQFVLLEGNHDWRAEAYMVNFPDTRGTVDYDKRLNLKDRGVKWVRSWETGKLFKKGNACFTHGKFINKYHANKMAHTYGVCIYYGHTHDVMEVPVERLGDNSTVVGKSLGCLCDYKQKYLRGGPTKWQQAFAVFYFFPDGYYTEHTVRIFKHRFVSPEGKVYDGRKIK